MSPVLPTQRAVYDAIEKMGLKYTIDPSDPVTWVAFRAEDGHPRLMYALVVHEEIEVVEMVASDFGAIPPDNRQAVLEEVNRVQSSRACPAVKWSIDDDDDLCAATAIDIEHSANPSVAVAICFTNFHRQVQHELPRILAAAHQTPEQRELAAVVDRRLSEILGASMAGDNE